jgi:transcriptional activator of cad operon
VDRPTANALRVGDWCVSPAVGQISKDEQIVRLDARTMRLLIYLAERAGQVVSSEELLAEVWAGVVVTQDSVYQAVASLRRLLGDDARQPQYIATVPRLGYRLIARVVPWDEQSWLSVDASEGLPEPATVEAPVDVPVVEAVRLRQPRRTMTGIAIAVALVCVIVAAIMTVRRESTERAAADRSVAVLPFLDLTTQDMNEEYFADGMTEELIGRLSKIPGLRVPAPTASFYYKGKQLPVTEIAHALGVTYVVDGSVRKSGSTARIAARLVRASDGYVVWSETYDRPFDDKLAVQEDIAAEVTRAFRTALD